MEVGSDRGISDEERGIHGSEVEDVALMREVRAVRRKTPRQTNNGGSSMLTHSSLWRVRNLWQG